jgi:CheY-like chemotaxis protein
VQSQAAEAPKPGRRVLVVDDDVDTARLLVVLLGQMGHDAAYATSGREALRAAETLRPEFIFLDIGLPDLDGSDVARNVRTLPGCDSALIIAVTGLGDEHRARMLSAGCDAFYMKPLDPKLVESLLKS